MMLMMLSLYSQNVNKYGVKRIYKQQSTLRSKDDIALACPEGTVKAGEYVKENSGIQCSDEGRPGMSSKFYQSYSDLYFSVDSIRVLATFTNFDEDEGWRTCLDRDIFDKEGNIIKPLKLQLSFYETDNDGMPGKMVCQKIQDVYGIKTGLSISERPLYTFVLKLDEPIKMPTGYFSVSAVNQGDSPKAWFTLIATKGIPGFGLIEINEGEYWMRAFNSMTYCMMGSGEMLTKHSLKVDSFIWPDPYYVSSCDPVQVLIKNVGSEEYSNPTLQLWCDDKLIATEVIPIKLKSLESYKYRFKQHLYLDGGAHTIKVKTINPGDVHLFPDEIIMNTMRYSKDNPCPSGARKANESYISRVKIGTIDNKSGASGYSDYRYQQTEIKPGDSLELSVETQGEDDKIAVWVDWNENGMFDDKYEYMGLVKENKPFLIRVPQGIDIEEGPKTLRIIYTYGSPQPFGLFSYGETEDYTLVVKRTDDTKGITISEKEIYTESDKKDIALKVEMNNYSNKIISGFVDINYFLPGTPFPTSYLIQQEKKQKVKKESSLRAVQPDNTDNFAYILMYDQGARTAFKYKGDSVQLGQFYPKEMLETLKGMTITSVDAYIYDLPSETELIIYASDDHFQPKKIVRRQMVNPQPQVWNRILLDEPYIIKEGESLWVALRLKGFEYGKFYLGIDKDPTIVLYSDLFSLDPLNQGWKSLYETEGVKGNFSIRTNIEGTLPDEMNWLNIKPTTFDLKPNSKQVFDININANQLEKKLYKALITIYSNDELKSRINIPVYMVSGVPTSTEKVTTDNFTVQYNREENKYTILTNQKVKSYRILDISGTCVESKQNEDDLITIDCNQINNQFALIVLKYDNGNIEAIKLINPGF